MAEKSTPFDLSPVKSSNVAAIGYDAGTERFGVQFKSGATYHYSGVAQKVADEIMSAESVGSAVHARLVKGGFAYERLDKDD